VKAYRIWAFIVAAVAVVAGVAVVRWNSLSSTEDGKSGSSSGSSAGSSRSSWTLFSGIGSTGSARRTGKPAIEFTVPTVKEYDGGSFDLENLTVVKYVEKYRTAAVTGQNPDAAYRVYMAERMCSHIPETQRRQGEVVDDEADACVGVTPAMIYERHQFLRQAAQGGIAEAAMDFYRDGPPGHEAGDPIPADWAADAIGFLRASGEHGDTYALHTLASVYQQGQLVPPDTQKALTYKAAMLVLHPYVLPGGSPVALEDTPIIKTLSAGLSPEQVAGALQEGRTIAAQCCEKH
jgi:hypothetical protein